MAIKICSTSPGSLCPAINFENYAPVYIVKFKYRKIFAIFAYFYFKKLVADFRIKLELQPSQSYWCLSLIPGVRSPRKIVSLRPAWATQQNHVSKNKETNNKSNNIHPKNTTQNFLFLLL
jgi:hypothetical protein